MIAVFRKARANTGKDVGLFTPLQAITGLPRGLSLLETQLAEKPTLEFLQRSKDSTQPL